MLHHATVRHDSTATYREQALCRLALESSKYDELSDDEWVTLCEKAAKEAEKTSREATERIVPASDRASKS